MAVSAGGDGRTDDSFADQAFGAAADAYARAPGAWGLAVRAAIAELFDFLSSRPRQTSACIAADRGAGPGASTGHERTIARFTALLQAGFAPSAAAPPPVVAEAIGGGIYEVVRSHVLERRLEELPDAVPDATLVALSPFLGPDGASEIAATDAAVRRGR